MNTISKKCPENNIELISTNYEGVQIDQCTLCGGIWCDNEELQEIIKIRIKKFDKETIKSIKNLNVPTLQLVTNIENLVSRKCVVCGEKLQRQDYSKNIKIVIDCCRKGHGIWLDENELERIQILSEN
jgi:Zn-finger nucleic acid-binding protein